MILELEASPARPQLVVDASVSLKWVFDDEEHVARALALREDGLSGRFQMMFFDAVAPNLSFVKWIGRYDLV